MDVALIRPPPRALPKPAPKPHPRVRPSEVLPTAPPQAAPVAPPPPAPPPPKSLDVPRMTDKELLSRAGPRPDIARLHAQEALQPMFSRRLGRPPEAEAWVMGGCKPMSEHSNRDAPPCKVGGSEDLASRALGDHNPGRNGFAGEARYKDAMKAYRERPGSMNPDDYPSIKCAILHKC